MSRIDATDVDGAREEVFRLIHIHKKEFIYFDGWNGFGSAPVLRSIAQVLPSIRAKNTPPELCYDRIIYLDCSAWISKREMQRKIVEELELDRETMALFDKQDEDDDFNGVDRGSRDVIRRVSHMIAEKLWSKRYILVFLNGCDDVVDLNKFGLSLDYHDITIVWTFKRRFLTIHGRGTHNEIKDKLRDIINLPGATSDNNKLETIWASDLLMARSIWSKGSRETTAFENLQHLHLRCCPRLHLVLPVWVSSFPNLETIHIIHCGDLRHVFVLDERFPKEIHVRGVTFPKLTTIHLYDLPKLQCICEVKMLAPSLETIKIRGCWNLRRLPALEVRKPGVNKKPGIEMEKDVWDALEWDGLAAGHCPDLYEVPLHSRYYKRSRLLRGTVLR